MQSEMSSTFQNSLIASVSGVIGGVGKAKGGIEMEGYYVYIIKSTSKFIYYKGSSSDPNNRLTQHNNNESRFTSGKGPWILVFVSKFEN